MKKLFIGLSVILSVVMCAVVAYNYYHLTVGMNSAPPYVAFFYAIPFAVGIVLCLILALVFRKK